MVCPDSFDTLGNRLKAKRINEGLTQKQLGKKAGVSQQVISQIEKDKTTHSASIHLLAKALNTTSEYLLDGDGGFYYVNFKGCPSGKDTLQFYMALILISANVIEESSSTTIYELEINTIKSDDKLNKLLMSCFSHAVHYSSVEYQQNQPNFQLIPISSYNYLLAFNFKIGKLIIAKHDNTIKLDVNLLDAMCYVLRNCPKILPLYNFISNEFEYERLDSILSECNDSEIDEINTYMMKHGSNIDINDAIRTSFINNSEKIVSDLHGSIAVTVATQLTPNQSAALKKSIENWMHVHSRTFDPKNYL